MVHKIIRFPQQSLRSATKAIDFTKVDRDALFEHIRDLQDTLRTFPNGAALASNQVLTEGFRVFVTNPVMARLTLPIEVVNPTWTTTDEKPEFLEEGCLSIPEFGSVHARIPRFHTVELTWQNSMGAVHKETYHGLDAQVIQHECEHLDGKLIIDHLPKHLALAVRTAAIKNRKAGK